MNWNIIIVVVNIITNIVLGYFCYHLGCNTVKPIEDNNNLIKQENAKLKEEQQKLFHLIDKLNCEEATLNQNIEIKEQKKISLDNELHLKQKQKEEVQNFIDQSSKLATEKAEAIYEKRYDELKQEYKTHYIELHSILERNENLIKEQKNELESLQKTRAAAVAAAQKEKEIQKNKNDYCLILPIEYSNDVKILRGIAKQIAKPRSILMAIWQAYYAPLAKKKFPQILGKTDMCGIYKITNQETGECYIGQAVDIRRRWMDHCKAGLGIDTPQGNQLYAAMQQYGLDSFSFELLLECESKQLNEKEKYFIELYNSNAIGYNGNKGVG